MHPEVEVTTPLPEIQFRIARTNGTELSEAVKEETETLLQSLVEYLTKEITTRVEARLGTQIKESPVRSKGVAESKTLFSVKDPITGKRALTPEAKQRISESQKLRWSTRPRKLTPEAKAKISESQKTRWAIRNASSRESQPSEADRPASTDVAVTSPEATLAVKEGYTGDPFYISASGHFIGDDGFVVPQNCDEFLDRFPKYIENWVRKRLNGYGIEEDIEDWKQELIIHMRYLPATSKHRVAGKTDVFQVFDPFAQYGASERRWRNYVNNCLKNKFNTIHGKKAKNPVCRPGNLTFGMSGAPDDGGSDSSMSDEYIYSKSEFLSKASMREEKNKDDLFFATRFIRYVFETDPEVFPILEAVYVAGSSSDTVREFCKTCMKLATTVERTQGLHDGHEVGLTQKEFNRARNKLKGYAGDFMKNESSKKGVTQ